MHSPIDYHRETYTVSDRVFYMGSANLTSSHPEEIWNSTEGLLLQSFEGNIYASYPFYDSKNVKYSNTGLRLPPYSKSTNSMYSQ